MEVSLAACTERLSSSAAGGSGPEHNSKRNGAQERVVSVMTSLLCQGQALIEKQQDSETWNKNIWVNTLEHL